MATKAELIARIQSLGERLEKAEATINERSNWALAESIEDIERQIEVIEAETALEIAALVNQCEEKTGRPFTFVLKSGEKASSAKTVTKFSEEQTLKEMVRIVAEKAAGSKYSWKEPCQFYTWAKPLFKKAWERYKENNP